MKIWSIYCGSFLLGLVIGYLIGNSNTPVSAIAISSMLGFFGSVLAAILKNETETTEEGKHKKKELNLRIIGFIFICFSLGMLSGTVLGQLLRGWYYSAEELTGKDQGLLHKLLINLTPVSHKVPNP